MQAAADPPRPAAPAASDRAHRRIRAASSVTCPPAVPWHPAACRATHSGVASWCGPAIPARPASDGACTGQMERPFWNDRSLQTGRAFSRAVGIVRNGIVRQSAKVAYKCEQLARSCPACTGPRHWVMPPHRFRGQAPRVRRPAGIGLYGGPQLTVRKKVLDGSVPCDWEKNGVNESPMLDSPS